MERIGLIGDVYASVPRVLFLLLSVCIMVACSLPAASLTEQPDILSILTQEAQVPIAPTTSNPFATRTPVGTLEAPFIQLPGMHATEGGAICRRN